MECQILAVIKYIQEDNITVTGLKSMNTSKQTFKLIKNDVFDINFEKIQAALMYPKVDSVGKCIKYIFPNTLDVREGFNIVVDKNLLW